MYKMEAEENQMKKMEDMDKGRGNQEFRLNRSPRILFSQDPGTIISLFWLNTVDFYTSPSPYFGAC